ncbi:MAG: hypothetical protein AAGB13_12840 [Cyanobacteria bacterium P01_F01_bin.33]
MKPDNALGRSEEHLELEKQLYAIDVGEPAQTSVQESPGLFLRKIYDIWVENGGKIDGRYNRNSLTKLSKLLGEKKRVRSLHPKLAGHVRVPKSDAHSLISIFLANWKYSALQSGDPEEAGGKYIQFPTNDLDRLVSVLTRTLFENEDSGKGILLPNTYLLRVPEEEVESAIELSRHIPASSVAITISRQKIILGHDIQWTMKTFWHLFHNSYSNEDSREHFMPIWIVDLGSRIVEDRESFRNFHNVGFLAMSFVALATFSSAGEKKGSMSVYRQMNVDGMEKQKDFWRWFSRRSVIFVQNLQDHEFLDYFSNDRKKLRNKRFSNIGITAEQILPTSIPAKWTKKIRDLYGKDCKDLNDTTLLVQISGTRNEQTDNVAVRYYAYSQTGVEDQDQLDAKSFRNAELTTPGDHYDEAMMMIHRAARYALYDEFKEIDITEDDTISYSYLASIGFEPLTLRNFVQIFWSSIDILED